MGEWFYSENKKPEENQEVWYFFPELKGVFRGFFTRIDLSYEYGLEDGFFVCDQFYGDRGFLTDEKVYWMPVESSRVKPSPPFKKKIEWSLEASSKEEILKELQLC